MQKGLICMANQMHESDEELDNNRIEELDQPTSMTDLPIQINWSSDLPPGITVPQVNIHSIVLDFSAVSFLDFSAMRVLQKVIFIPKTDSNLIQEKHKCGRVLHRGISICTGKSVATFEFM